MGFENSVKLATAELWNFATWLEVKGGDRWFARPNECRMERLKRLVRFGLAGCLHSEIVAEFRQFQNGISKNWKPYDPTPRAPESDSFKFA